MPAFSIGSSSSLASWKQKSSAYQKAINALNVIILIVSIYMIGEANMMFKIYHLPKLGFWCHYFVWFPTTMLILGIYLLVSSLYSIAVACSPNSAELCYRVVVGMIALLYTISFFGTIFLVFCSLKLQNSIYYVQVTDSKVFEHMGLYGTDEAVKSDWDIIQSDIRCCGGSSMSNGYDDWRRVTGDTFNPTGNDVPDSCCLPDELKGMDQEGCGVGVNKDLEARSLVTHVSREIWMNGCIWVLEQKIKHEIGPRLWYMAGGGVVLILIQLIIVVLASSYVATLNRRVKRSNTMEMH